MLVNSQKSSYLKKAKNMARKFSVMFVLFFAVNILATNVLRTNIFAQETQDETQKPQKKEITQDSSSVIRPSPQNQPTSKTSTIQQPLQVKPKPVTNVPLFDKKKKRKKEIIEEPIPSSAGLSKKTSSITALHLEWQFANAPEDPMFAYEKRYIPFLNPPEDFMAPQVEKEIIVERIEEEKVDYKKIAKKYVPNTLQIIVISIVFIIFIIYRIQISSNKKRRKIFKVKK